MKWVSRDSILIHFNQNYISQSVNSESQKRISNLMHSDPMDSLASYCSSSDFIQFWDEPLFLIVATFLLIVLNMGVSSMYILLAFLSGNFGAPALLSFNQESNFFLPCSL